MTLSALFECCWCCFRPSVPSVPSVPVVPSVPSVPYVDWKQRTYDSTPDSLLSDRRFRGRLLDVYDADTITCAVQCAPGTFVRVQVRLLGVDACEMTSKTPAAKALAVRARDRVIEFLTNSFLTGGAANRAAVRALLQSDVFLVDLDLRSRDKYGRQLGHVYSAADGTQSASDMLIAERLAVRYDGKGPRMDEAAMVEALQCKA